MNRLRTLLSMGCMLLRYNLKPWPNSCVLPTVWRDFFFKQLLRLEQILDLDIAGSIICIGLSINRCSHSSILYDEGKSDCSGPPRDLRDTFRISLQVDWPFLTDQSWCILKSWCSDGYLT